MLCTLAKLLSISHAIRDVNTRVFPLPAPANTSVDFLGDCVTALVCSRLRLTSGLEESGFSGNMGRGRLKNGNTVF